MKRIYFSLVAVIMLGCYKEKDYVLGSDESGGLFQLQVTTTTLPADSASTALISVVFDPSVDTARAIASFKTTLGTFIESGNQSYSVTAKYNYDSARLMATAHLKTSTTVGDASVTVTVGSFSKTATIHFIRSYPEFSELSASSLSLSPKNGGAGEVIFTNKISRGVGFPSQGSIVDLGVYDSLFKSIGSFRTYANRPDVNGLTSYTYVLGDSVANGNNYTGRLYAISRVQKTETTTDVLRDTVIIISSK